MPGIVERSFYDEATDSLTVQTLYDPPLGVTLLAMWIGYVIGVLVFCVSELFARWEK